MSSITYVVSILKDAGFKSSQLKPATPIHINKVFSNYLNSCEWSEEWFFSIDPSQLDGEQLKLYDSAKELYDTPDGEVLSDTEDMMITLQLQLGVAECEADAVIIKFSEFYALSIYYHVLKNTTADVWANGNEHEEYASEYSKALLSHYGYDDDEYLTDTTLEKNFSDVVKQLVHDPYDLWVIAHMTSKVVKEYHAHCQEYLWTSHKSDILNGWAKYVPVPSGSSQYVIACDVEVVEPTLVHHDVKLDDVELPVIVPQEVVEEPQEDCLSTTTEDNVMNTNTVWLDWSITPCLKAWELDFGTYVPVVESEPVVEVVNPHYSDKWFGQCCDLNDNPEFTQWDIVRTGKPYFPEVVEFTPLPSKAPSIMNIGRGKVSFSKVLTPEQLAEAEASVARASAKMARRSAYASPVRCGVINNTTSTVATTTKSDKKESNARLAELTTMWERVVNPHAHSTTYVSTPLVDGLDKTYSRPIASATGRDYQYSTQVKEFKSTLFNVDEYDITRNVVVDVATTTPKSTPATPKATVAPKVSTATFASNFNSLVIAKYRELNNGIIKDSLVLNKLTSALRNNNLEAYNSLITTFGNPTAVALHKQAYDAIVSAS